MDSDAAGSHQRITPTPSGFRPDWAMLDCYLRPSRDSDNSNLVYVSIGTGGKIGITLMAAPPPRVSYLIYHWIPNEGRRGGSSHKSSRPQFADGTSCSTSSSRLKSKSSSRLLSSDAQIQFQSKSSSRLQSSDGQIQFWDAKAVAAHGSSILLRFLFPTNTGSFPDKSEEFFVYQATRRTLTKLPTCHHTFMNCNTEKNTGILCRESGEFVVAHLTLLTGGHDDCCMNAELCCIFGWEDSWRTTKHVLICQEKFREDLVWWETDAVISFGQYICWIDYLRGMLLCDVSTSDPKIKYVPLPISPYKGRLHPHLGIRGSMATHRSLCVTSNGGVKFVDVASDNNWFCGKQEGVPTEHFTIKSWLLTKELSWVVDYEMTEYDFLHLIPDCNFPRPKVECPLVDAQDSETIYFALEEENQSCLVEVNMKSKVMHMISCQFERFGTSCMYSDTTSCNIYYHEPFLQLNLEAPNFTRAAHGW